MNKCIRLLKFTQLLFECPKLAEKAACILQGILSAKSPRLSDISQHMPGGHPEGNYKLIQRFLAEVDVKAVLMRLFRDDARYVIGDVTEIERPQARQTPYVGVLKDGKTKGFWLLTLGTPYRGRAIPCDFVVYSSRTIREQADSRNINHFRAFAPVKALLGNRPLVLDREFSYLELLVRLMEEKVRFVIRLDLRSHPPVFLNDEGQRMELAVSPGQKAVYKGVRYKGKVPVNLIGVWKPGLSEPLWVMTDLPAERGLDIYLQRMKIEETFRDLKSLLNLDHIMNKTQANLEQVIALVMLAFTIGLLLGETIRDYLFGVRIQEHETVPVAQRIPESTNRKKTRKWGLYSGLFLLLKRQLNLDQKCNKELIDAALCAFTALLYPPVRTYV